MKRQLLTHLSFLVLCFILIVSIVMPGSALAEGTAPEQVAEGFDLLNGEWYVGGIYKDLHLFDLRENDALADLYDSIFLTFNADGSFTFYNHFLYTGTYVPYNSSGSKNACFLLKIQNAFQFVVEDDVPVRKEVDISGVGSRIIVMTDNSNTSFFFNKFDPLTGKESKASEPFVFVRGENRKDTFIDQNKWALGAAYASRTTPKATVTTGQQNALQAAKNYLSIMSFSYYGLINQLEYEGYTASEAKYGADHCGADWYEQAAKKAAEYLEIMPFSQNGLIEQLEYEGFSYDEASFGARQNGY